MATKACKGYYFDKCILADSSEKKTIYNPKILLVDIYPGVDEGVQTWYPEPGGHFTIDGHRYVGTFRSTNCKKITLRSASICLNCINIEKLTSFKRRLKLRGDSQE